MATTALTISSFRPGSGTVGDDAIPAGAGIDADKLQHLHKAGSSFALAIGGTPVTREEIIFIASAAGNVRRFAALLNVDGTTTSITFDLKKNGTTILSGVVTLTDSTGNRVELAGSISSAAFVAGDVFSIAMTVASATGAQGPYAYAEFEELAA